MRSVLAFVALLAVLILWFTWSRGERGAEPAGAQSAAAAAVPAQPPAAALEPSTASEGRAKEEAAASAPTAPRPQPGAPSAEEPLHALLGTVRDDQGRFVVEYEVRAERKDLPAGAPSLPVRLDVRDAGGRFRLEGLAAGTWEVTFRAEGLGVELRKVLIPRSEPLELVLRRRARVHGVAFGPDGFPCGEVDVHSDRAEGREDSSLTGPRVARTRLDGGFECVLPAGSVRLQARAPGFAPSLGLWLELEPGEERFDLELRLRPAGRIVGEVLGLDGGAVERLSVLMHNTDPADEFVSGTGTTPDGRFEFADVPGGDYELSTTLDGGVRLEARTTLEPGGTAFVRLAPESRPYVHLHGRVTFSGEPHARVSVDLYDAARASESVQNPVASANCDPQGRYEFRVPGGEDYSFRVASWEPHFLSARVELALPAAGEHPFDLDLATGRLSGRVVASDGAALPGCQVAVRSAEDPQASKAQLFTGPDGHFELEALAGELSVQVYGPKDVARSYLSVTRTDLSLRRGELVEGLEFVLPIAGKLVGVVRREDGTPVAGASLFLHEEGEWKHVGWSARDGSFALDELPAGALELGATAPQLSTRKPVAVQVVEGTTTPVEVTVLAFSEGTLIVRGDVEGPVQVTWTDDLGEVRNLEAMPNEGLPLGALFEGRHTFSTQVDDHGAVCYAIVRAQEPEIDVVLSLD